MDLISDRLPSSFLLDSVDNLVVYISHLDWILNCWIRGEWKLWAGSQVKKGKYSLPVTEYCPITYCLTTSWFLKVQKTLNTKFIDSREQGNIGRNLRQEHTRAELKYIGYSVGKSLIGLSWGVCFGVLHKLVLLW